MKTKLRAMRRLIATALVAWNTPLLPEAGQAESLKQVSKTLPADTVDDFYAIIGEMIERKNRFFKRDDLCATDVLGSVLPTSSQLFKLIQEIGPSDLKNGE